MMPMSRTTVAVSLLVLATACSRQNDQHALMRQAQVAAEPAPIADARAGAVAPRPVPSASAIPSPVTATPLPRRLIRTGTISVQVEDASLAVRQIEDIAETHAGYVSALQGGFDAQGHGRSIVTIRVDPAQFLRAMKELRALGTLESDSVSTEDVGAQYADLEARLKTKQAVAVRMREILAGNTASLQDIFEAERQLTAVLEQLEQLEAQRRHFDEQVGLSTITASVHEPVPVLIAGAPPAGPAFLAPAREALRVGREHLSALVGVATYLAVVGGPWSLLALAIILVARRMGARGAATPA